jgi:dTMP kinase
MVDDENFIVIDGTLEIEKQQNIVRRHVSRTLKLKNQIQGHILQ